MAVVTFGSLALLMLMGLPALTYLYAKQLGRNPKKWFLIGVLLPGVATLILSFLPDLSEEKQKTNEA